MNRSFFILLLYFSFFFFGNLKAQSSLQVNDSVFQRCQKIIFKDDLNKSKIGQQDTHWNVLQGNERVDSIAGSKAVSFKENGITVLKPANIGDKYLGYEFTLEFDVRRGDKQIWGTDSTFVIYFNSAGNKNQSMLAFTYNYAEYLYPDTKKFYPDVEKGMAAAVNSVHAFGPKVNKNSNWIHVALACGERQVRLYLGYDLCISIRNTGISPANFFIGTVGSNKNTIYIKNFKVAIHEPSEEIKKFLATGKMTTYAINFDFNSAAIKPQSKIFIADVADVLKQDPNIKIAINGYTDNSGTPEYNLNLSAQRAEAVKNDLVSMGIDAFRISTKGFGESKPIGDNNTEEGKAKNRRIEFVALK